MFRVNFPSVPLRTLPSKNDPGRVARIKGIVGGFAPLEVTELRDFQAKVT